MFALLLLLIPAWSQVTCTTSDDCGPTGGFSQFCDFQFSTYGNCYSCLGFTTAGPCDIIGFVEPQATADCNRICVVNSGGGSADAGSDSSGSSGKCTKTASEREADLDEEIKTFIFNGGGNKKTCIIKKLAKEWPHFGAGTNKGRKLQLKPMVRFDVKDADAYDGIQARRKTKRRHRRWSRDCYAKEDGAVDYTYVEMSMAVSTSDALPAYYLDDKGIDTSKYWLYGDKPWAHLSITQTTYYVKEDGTEDHFEFEMWFSCSVAYSKNGCERKGLKCRTGFYSTNSQTGHFEFNGDEIGSMRCRDASEADLDGWRKTCGTGSPPH